MKKYKQSGRNDKYPKEIEIWKFGEQPIPDWISDRCKIKFIDAEGNITLDYRETNTGGIEFISADGTRTEFTLRNKNNYACWGDNRLFTLREAQLNLLYKEEKDKKGRET